ncbi:protein zer-1 homolog isoform X1 [Haliotis rufescens]|uniref:protein zer-1 homolog isoform X1 n=1 Tax=Haliotis rufescens TaxID=6454 RepID=UPI001EAFC826|nr:protein zer-1 homolog isoform X1 [Haliotis rufescens]
MESWPRNMPASLEDLCVQYCVEHLETFTHHTTTTDHTTKCTLFPGVSLPKTICDKIFDFYMEHVDHVHCNADGFLNIFSNTRGTQLSRVTLANSNVTDCGLGLVKDQPIAELDLSCCTRLSSDCIPFINAMGKTLRSLRLESITYMFEGVRDGDSIFATQSEADSDGEPSANVEKNDDPILKCPHLRKLCMRDFQLEENWHDGTLQLHDIFRWCKLLTHLDLTQCNVATETFPHFQCLQHLMSLSLADVYIHDLDAVIDSLCQLKQLKHLDVSQGQCETPVMYPRPEQYLQQLVAGLPRLTSLDISGTNLAGFEKAEIQSFRPSRNQHGEDTQHMDSSAVTCSIPGLEGRTLEFLGLFGCAHDACYRKNIPAKRVSGESDEEQVLLSLQVYQDRCGLLIKALNSLFHLFRNFAVNRQCAVLEAILAGMKRHLWDKQVQIVGSASLFYIAKGEQKDYITQKQRRKIISLLLRAMETYPTEQTMLRNGCLTLSIFNIPHDVMYCYEKLVNFLLRMLERAQRDDYSHRIGIFLLNCLACQVDGREKEIVGSLGAIETMLSIIRRKLLADVCDDVMEVAWSTMWNVTDETAANCERFMDKDGMGLFLSCLEKFKDHAELLRNMMGLMGNIAEVKELRPRLMVTEYVQVFSDLLDSTSDGIEVSYNAAGVLAHLASDQEETWLVRQPSRQEVLQRMVGAINRWDIRARRNINYRSFQPILRLLTIFATPEVQHWAVWALCNLCGFCPDKYCSLLEKECGIGLLESIQADTRPYKAIQSLAQRVLKQVQARSSWEDQDQEDQVLAGAVGGGGSGEGGQGDGQLGEEEDKHIVKDNDDGDMGFADSDSDEDIRL